MEQLQEGGSFTAYARQYSEASTKAVGGDLGWIRLAQLPTELANVRVTCSRASWSARWNCAAASRSSI
jgi:hypothetical protein